VTRSGTSGLHQDVRHRLRAAGLGNLAGEASAITAHWQVILTMAAAFDAPAIPAGDSEDGGPQGA
jgi:hypothetical protein